MDNLEDWGIDGLIKNGGVMILNPKEVTINRKILLNKIWDILQNDKRYGEYDIKDLVNLIMIEIDKYIDFKLTNK